MDYRIFSTGPDGVILRKSRFTAVLFWLIMVIGLLFSLPSSLALLAPGGLASPAPGFLGFGLVFVAGGLILRQASARFPKEISFDNRAGIMVMRGPGSSSVSLPYADLQGFAVRRYAQGGSILYLRGRNGVVYDLIRFGWRHSKKPAETLERLSTFVTLGAVSGTVNFSLPAWMRRDEAEGETWFMWKDPVAFTQLLGLLCMTTGFGLAVFQFAEVQILRLGGLAFFAGGGLLLVAYQAAQRLLFRTMVLAVGPAELRWGISRAGAGQRRGEFLVKQSLRRAEFRSADYSLDTLSGGYAFVPLLDAEAMNFMETVRVGDIGLGDIKKLIGEQRHLVRIPFAGCPVTELVHFGKILDRELNQS